VGDAEASSDVVKRSGVRFSFREGYALEQAHLRVARPTDNLAESIRFYRDGLGFEILASFENHQGFDGVMLGHASLAYHLEFTHHRGHHAGRAPTEEISLVFYLPEEGEWQQAVDHMFQQGYEPVRSINPYGDVQGNTFVDTDGCRVVLQRAAWP
jgi:catechol 2,3-dioxygenase-like lactoylglutathione lyase family enzyme